MSTFAVEAYRGDTIRLNVPVTRDGVAVNVTGATFKFTAKRGPNDADADLVFQKTSAGGTITVATPTNGIALVTIAPADTSGLPDTLTLYCDCQMTESSGLVTTVSYGTLRVIADVTRA